MQSRPLIDIAVRGILAGALLAACGPATEAKSAVVEVPVTSDAGGVAPVIVPSREVVAPRAAMPEPEADPCDSSGKHACKGMNQCKGQGGCKNENNGCKGQNDCKGKGGCKTC